MLKKIGMALLLCVGLAHGAETEQPKSEPTEKVMEAQPGSPGKVKLDLIKNMETDGMLSAKMASEARVKYITTEDLKEMKEVAKEGPSMFDRLMTWTNFFYTLGVIALLVGFGRWIALFAMKFIDLIVMVPKEVYQTTFMAGSVALTTNMVQSSSLSFYGAVFGAVANLIIGAWILNSHPKLAEALRNMFKLGIPMGSVLSFWLMLYFGGLALMWNSELFGFFAAVFFSGILTFTIGYQPGVLWMDFEKKAMPAVILGNLIAVGLYGFLKVSGNLPAHAELFEIGLTYYCTIAMGVGFLVAASPYEWRNDAAPGSWLMLLVAVLWVSVYGYAFHDFKVVGSIVCVFALLVALEWYGKLCTKAGFIGGMLMAGTCLVGLAHLMEKYGGLLILKSM